MVHKYNFTQNIYSSTSSLTSSPTYQYDDVLGSVVMRNTPKSRSSLTTSSQLLNKLNIWGSASELRAVEDPAVRNRIRCNVRQSGRSLLKLDDICSDFQKSCALLHPAKTSTRPRPPMDPNYYKIRRGAQTPKTVPKAEKGGYYKLDSSRVKFTDMLMPHERHEELPTSKFATIVTHSALPPPGKQQLTRYEKTLEAGPRNGPWEKFTQPGFSGNRLYPRKQFAYEVYDI